nr:hypothetical protein [Tanacetum cinerariifolium]
MAHSNYFYIEDGQCGVDESSLSDGLGLRYLGILDYSIKRVPIQTHIMVLLFGHVVFAAAGLTVDEVGATVAGVVAVGKKGPFVEDKFALKSDVVHDCMHEGAGIWTFILHNVLEEANIVTLVAAKSNQPRLAILRSYQKSKTEKDYRTIKADSYWLRLLLTFAVSLTLSFSWSDTGLLADAPSSLQQQNHKTELTTTGEWKPSPLTMGMQWELIEVLGSVSVYDLWFDPPISEQCTKPRYEHATTVDDKMYLCGGNHNGH